MDPKLIAAIRTGPSSETAQRIRVARVLCIFFVVYAHTYLGKPASLVASLEIGNLSNAILLMLHDGLARVSVPLLGCISGYLAMTTVPDRHGYFRMLRAKTMSLVVPMTLWSLALLVVYWSAGTLSEDSEFLEQQLPTSLSGWVNALFAVSREPFNLPLYFLRDLFVCFAFFPVLRWLVRHLPWLALGVATIIFLGSDSPRAWRAWTEIPLFFQPRIPAMFVLGMLTAEGRFELIRSKFEMLLERGWPMILLLACGVAIWPHLASANIVSIERPRIYGADRVLGCLFLWGLTLRVAKSSIGSKIAQFSNLAFLVFCTHVIIDWLLQQIYGAVFDWATPMIIGWPSHILMPLFCFVVAFAVRSVLEPIFPRVVKLLAGGR